jgi:DNA polymerase-3 subunit epsilon
MLGQRSFDDLGTPLADVTFCVIDLETTGTSPLEESITEVGALKVRRGEVIGTFETLVDPGRPVPQFVRILTGIGDETVAGAPFIDGVLPDLLEFTSGTVLVAHNARFDVGFINASLARNGYEPLANPVVDTALLARKLLAGEVRDHKLSTLAAHLRCGHQPCHRAFADVLATVDVLHTLFERAAGYGVTTLEDLMSVSASRLDGTFSKIALAQGLPASTGIYRFVGSTGQTLYVGKAADIRRRVRSYFYGDPRRRIRDLLRETAEITAQEYPTTLEAEVAEARAIAAELPPYNRVGKGRSTWYLKFAHMARAPRAWPVRTPKDDGALYLGPFPHIRSVRELLEALRDGTNLHRCTDPARCRGCAFSELASCSWTNDSARARETRAVAVAMIGHPDDVYEALTLRMQALAARERFEEAAEVRERGAALQRAITRDAELRALLHAEDVVVRVGTRVLLIRDARLVATETIDDDEDRDEVVRRLRSAAPSSSIGAFFPTNVVGEARVLASWLRRNAHDAEIVTVAGTWAMPVGAGPSSRFVIRES